MHIIIDGYNLIRQSVVLRRYERHSLEAGRLALMSRLADYKRKRGHRITVVFDGWKGGSEHEERDRQGNIDIIYSRHGEKADDVIKRITVENTEETIVVSSDREIASYITRHGKTSLSSVEFEVIMNRTISPSWGSDFTGENKAGEDNFRNHKKKGPARRLPRTKRHAQKKIKKL